MGESTTFGDLGIPFALFDAPVRFASSYGGLGHCDVCDREHKHVFELGIGDAVITPCRNCKQNVAFNADDRLAVRCKSCGDEQTFPLDSGDSIRVCYECLQAGSAAFTQDSEFGMVRYEDALSGLTHGVPGLDVSGYDTVTNEDGWTQVKISPDHLLKLVRTPSYTTWQGERWLFCCGGPMIYIGEWQQGDFSKHSDDGNGPAFFESLSNDAGLSGWSWDELETKFPGVIYAFICKACAKTRLNWDCD